VFKLLPAHRLRVAAASKYVQVVPVLISALVVAGTNEFTDFEQFRLEHPGRTKTIVATNSANHPGDGTTLLKNSSSGHFGHELAE